MTYCVLFLCFFFQAEDGIRDHCVTGVQTCALPISGPVVVGYEPSTGTLKTQAVSNVDQPQINRNASVRQVAINTTPQEGRSEERRVGKECRCRGAREE